jgi:RND family efflux transporter MFP subunit
MVSRLKKLFGPNWAMLRVFIIIIVLFVGLGGLVFFELTKKAPEEVVRGERPLQVEVVEVTPENVPVIITGYGEVFALDEVTLSPEVPGRIVKIHPRLELGQVIPAGQMLFQIDPTNYKAAMEQAEALVERWSVMIELLQKQSAIDTGRLETLKRSRELAKEEFSRLHRLFQQNSVGTQSAVDAAERAYNQARDAFDQLARQVDLYPLQIRENQSQLKAARSQLARARADLDRCTVSAPFDARIKAVSVEQGQYVMNGSPVLTLVDDSILEMHISIDSRDARQWLIFRDRKKAEDKSWFNDLKPVECTLRWTEDRENHKWNGTLDRVVKFNQETRTLTLAIRIPAEKARSNDKAGLPLVEGMFCSVEIPGRTLDNVFRLPQWAVTFENTVYLNSDGRLKTVPVKVARTQDRYAFISSGLEPGDSVIVTRLVDPLENSLLELTQAEPEGVKG